MIIVGHLSACEMESEQVREPLQFADNMLPVLNSLYNPRHVPALIGQVEFYPDCVSIAPADQYCPCPYITWFNESYDLPMPADHGKVSSEYRY